MDQKAASLRGLTICDKIKCHSRTEQAIDLSCSPDTYVTKTDDDDNTPCLRAVTLPISLLADREKERENLHVLLTTAKVVASTWDGRMDGWMDIPIYDQLLFSLEFARASGAVHEWVCGGIFIYLQLATTIYVLLSGMPSSWLQLARSNATCQTHSSKNSNFRKIQMSDSTSAESKWLYAFETASCVRLGLIYQHSPCVNNYFPCHKFGMLKQVFGWEFHAWNLCQAIVFRLQLAHTYIFWSVFQKSQSRINNNPGKKMLLRKDHRPSQVLGFYYTLRPATL